MGAVKKLTGSLHKALRPIQRDKKWNSQDLADKQFKQEFDRKLTSKKPTKNTSGTNDSFR